MKNCNLRAIKLFIAICFVLISSMAYGFNGEVVLDIINKKVELYENNKKVYTSDIIGSAMKNQNWDFKSVVNDENYNPFKYEFDLQDYYSNISANTIKSVSLIGIHFKTESDTLINKGHHSSGSERDIVVLGFRQNYPNSDRTRLILVTLNENSINKLRPIIIGYKSTYKTIIKFKDYDGTTIVKDDSHSLNF